jgi:hypothetical protein
LKSRKEIFNFVSSKKVLIWGARMTGIEALRQLKAKKVNILGFVDWYILFWVFTSIFYRGSWRVYWLNQYQSKKDVFSC